MFLFVVYWMRLSPFGMRDSNLATQASSLLSLTLIFPPVDVIIIAIMSAFSCLMSDR